MFDSTMSGRCIASLRTVSLYMLPCALLAACGGDVAPLTSGGVADQHHAIKSQTFQYIGRSSQTFQVPSRVTEITITAEGAGTPSARGGFVKATIAVRPGATLAILVGGASHGYLGGYNGGADGGVCGIHGPCPLRAEGGAGASDVRLGSARKNRIVVAGGAGGNGGNGQHDGGFGGEGGGVSGGLGDDGVGVESPSGLVGGGGGGGGGMRHDGGKRGAAGKAGDQNIVPGNPGITGRLGFGGAGGTSSGNDLAGGSGGGGGGGYYGGGGGGSGANGSHNDGFGKGVASGGGGGGGASFVVARAKNIDVESGKGSDKNGLIIVSW
jgi:hypothetical protein